VFGEGEGPTELVGLYVGFFSEGVGIRKAKVIVWDGPDHGYTIRFLGKKEWVSGVARADIAFLVHEEEVEARIDDGDFVLKELVEQYVGFFSEGVGIRKGKVVAWDGSDRGYMVRLLEKKDCVKGVAGADIAFLVPKEEVEARMEDGDIALVRGSGERRSPGKSLRRVHTERGASAARASDKADLTGEDEADVGQALEVGGDSCAACVSACKKRAFSGSSDGREQRKRVCPSSIFVGVRPFWSQDRLLYGFRLRYGDRNMKYGAYEDENKAALARNYAARRLARLTPTTQ
jgi:hypothetical protein